MSRDGFYYDEQEAMDHERRLAMEQEQEPAWAHYRRRRPRPRRPRYFSGLMFRAVVAIDEVVRVDEPRCAS